jgi:hypothetical protein
VVLLPTWLVSSGHLCDSRLPSSLNTWMYVLVKESINYSNVLSNLSLPTVGERSRVSFFSAEAANTLYDDDEKSNMNTCL